MARATRRRQDSASGPRRARSTPRAISQPRLRQPEEREKLHWPSLLGLLAIFVLALVLRTAFVYDSATDDGFRLTGGSDPYYHKRVVDYVQDNGEHLVHDEMLNYPYGANNNRPPLFDWSIAITGLALSPFFEDTEESTWWAMELLPAIYGALIVFPVYAIGRAQFGRPAGLVAALFIAINAGHVSHSTLALADHDSYVIFFATTTFFFFMRGLTEAHDRRWVANWADWESIRTGLRDFVRSERLALGYAGLAGMTLAVIALSWKGFPYLMVIIYGYTVLQMVINMFRRVDSTSTATLGLIALALPVLLSYPFYHHMGFVSPWWDAPAYILLATFGAALLLVPTRDLPWLMVATSVTAAALTGYALLKYVFVDLGTLIFSGQGYFVRTKLFNTIAEAQAPTFSHFVFSFGVVTVWLAIGGLFWMAILPFTRNIWKKDYLFIVGWSVITIYMAQSAVRFIFNATPVFAILAGWITWSWIKWADYPTMWSNLKQYWTPGALLTLVILSLGGLAGLVLLAVDWKMGLSVMLGVLLFGIVWRLTSESDDHYTFKDRLGGIRRSVTIKHIAIAFCVAFMLVLPNLYQGIDAAVPFEEKKELDVQIYDALYFDLLRPDEYRVDQSSNRTLYPDGVAGMYNRTDGNQLWYLSTTTGPSFPASYWQEGLEWLATQDTNLAPEDRPGFISWWDYGFWAIDIGEHPTVADNFQFGYQLAGNFIASQSEQEALALMLYRLIEPEVDRQGNERFETPVREVLLRHYTEEDVATLEDILLRPAEADQYYDSDEYTDTGEVHKRNHAIRAARQILMQRTTAELADVLWEVEQVTGHSIRYYGADTRLMPYSWDNTGILYAPVTLADYDINDFIDVMAVLPSGEEITMAEASERAQTDPQFRIQDRKLVYKERFLNTMFLRSFIGWAAPDIGRDAWEGIPGIAGPLAQEELPPLPGWNLTHFKLVYFNSGLRILKYYDGATVTGVVRTPDGAPVANANVTVLDEYSTPHATVTTDAKGRYSMLVPAGNLSLVVSLGSWESEQEKLFKVSNNIIAQNIRLYVSEAQATRQTASEIRKDIIVDAASFHGQVFWDQNGDKEFNKDDMSLAGVTIIAENLFSGRNLTSITDENGAYEITEVAPGDYYLYADYGGHRVEMASYIGLSSVQAGQSLDVDGALAPMKVRGRLIPAAEVVIDTATLTLTDETNGTVFTHTGLGDYLFDHLLPGNYTLRLAEDALVGDWDNNSHSLVIAPGDEVRYFNQTLQMGFRVSGTLTVNGQPLAGAQVDFTNLQASYSSQMFTTASGAFSTVLPVGAYNVHTMHREGGLDWVYLSRLTSDAVPDHLEAVMETGNSVSGYLFRDLDGDARYDTLSEDYLTDTEVRFDSSRGGLRAHVGTNGRYEVVLPAGDFSAHAEYGQPGEASQLLATLRRVQVEYGTQTVNLPMVPAYEIFGLVLELTLGDELPLDATVSINSAAGSLTLWATPTGFFTTLPAGSYSVSAARSGYRPTATEDIDLYGAREANLQLTRLPTTVTGQVLDHGVPIDGATVTFTPIEMPFSQTRSFTTDATGHFTAALPPLAYEYRVDRERNGEQHTASGVINPAIGQPSLALGTIATTRQVELHGFAYGDGSAQPGTLTLRKVENVSQATILEVNRPDGFRSFVDPGIYYLTFDDGISSRHWGYLETLDIDQPMVHDLTLTKNQHVHGILRSAPTGQAIHEDVEIHFTSAMGVAVIPSNADDGDYGSFDLPADTYQVTVTQPGYQPFADTVTVSGSTSFNVALTPDSQPLTLNLTYSNATGHRVPLIGIDVIFSRTDYQEIFTTDEAGRIALPDMIPAYYDVTVDAYINNEAEHFTFDRSVFLRAGEGPQFFNYNVDRELQLAGVAYYDRDFDGRVDEGEALAGCNVEIWQADGGRLLHEGTADATGAFEFYLDSGTYLLWLHTANDLVSYVWLDAVSLTTAVTHDPALVRGVNYDLDLRSAFDGASVEYDAVGLTGPGFNLTLAPENGTLSAVLPPGDYHLAGEAEQLAGHPDWIYVLNHTLGLTVADDGTGEDINISRQLLRGLTVSVDTTSNTTRVGESVDFTFDLAGTGYRTTTYDIEVSEAPANWTASLSQAGVVLDSGLHAEVVVSIGADESIIPGVFQFFTVTIGWSDDDSETDDITHSFELKVTPTEPPVPDFTIRELTTEPFNVKPGHLMTLRAVVANTVPNSGEHAVPVAFYVDDNSIELATAELSGEDETEVVASWVATAGSHSFRAVIDAGGVFVETNEDNNEESYTQTVLGIEEEETMFAWWMIFPLVAVLMAIFYYAVRLRR